LHLSQRQFYCPDGDRHFNERVSFVDPKRTMTRRDERYVDDCCKASTLQKISAQENLVWHPVNEICHRGARKALAARPVSTVRAVGRDECALKQGHRDDATVLVDVDRVASIDLLEYREPAKWIESFNSLGAKGCEGIEVFCSDLWPGFSNTATAVFPKATWGVDRFHFLGHLHKAVDRQRKRLRRPFKDEDDCKRLKGAFLQHAENLTPDQKKTLDRAFLRAPPLKWIDEHKEKCRAIFHQHLTREQGEIELNKGIEEAKKMKNNCLNKFLYMLNDWKEYVLNYFAHRVTTSVSEGINNSIKTVKRRGYGFRNVANFKRRVLISFA
jgi:transposase